MVFWFALLGEGAFDVRVLVGFGLFKPEWQNQQKIFASVYSLLLPVFRDHGQYENNKIIV